VTAGSRRVVGALAVVCLLASPAQALIPDPVEAGLLARIAAALEAIHEFRLRTMDKLEEQLYNRLRGYAFPSRLFDPIRASAATVVDIRRQVQRLTCDWPMSFRTAGLRDALSDRVTWCRSSHHGIWGTHEAFWDGSLQEMHDYVATMTTNMISERAERTNTSWVRAHRDLFDEYTIMRNSPGEANRAEAAALAWANEVALGNGQVANQNLLVRQTARDLERFDAKKAADLTYFTYRSIATMGGTTPAPLPPGPEE
jgi:hypothetical protein